MRKTKLPIKASLTTRDGFHKCIDIEELKDVILIPRFSTPQKVSLEVFETLNDTVHYEVMEFFYERHREVKQKNGLNHIIAVYKEY